MGNVRRPIDVPRPRAIYISPGDPWGSPRGGQTAFAKQALEAFGNRFAVVSPAEVDDIPLGRWTLGDWKGTPIWRFNIGSYAPRDKSRAPVIPRRIVFRALIKKYLPEIQKIETKNIFCAFRVWGSQNNRTSSYTADSSLQAAQSFCKKAIFSLYYP